MENTKHALQPEVLQLLQSGTVIPAHPLVLDNEGNFDEAGQKKLTQYYINSGAGGVAVGVHTTQFEIREKGIDLYEPVLRVVADELKNTVKRPFIKVAGIVGATEQAIQEAMIAKDLGYDFGLLSMGGLQHYTEDELIERSKKVAEIIPVFGFYLQPAVGGRILSYNFWKNFAAIENVYAIKIAAFNRYQTLDVVRAVCNSPYQDNIALYTGNDDNIIADLLTPYRFEIDGRKIEKRFVGGLLGHWAFCTAHAVGVLNEVKECVTNNYADVENLLAKNIRVTDTNAAAFDVANNFKGSIAGIHEMLRREGIMQNIRCLKEREVLSPGQMEEIERVCRLYFPHLAGK